MYRLTDREIEIMHAIWDSENDQVPTGEILKYLNQNQTEKRYLQPVQVVLRRLCDKGVLECQKKGHLNYYVSLLNAEEYRKYETGTFIERLYGGKAYNLICALLRENPLDETGLERVRDAFEQKCGELGVKR